MSKLVWRYDVNTRQLVGNGVEVTDEYVLKDGETFDTPEEGLFPPITFNGTKWEGTTFEDWLKANQVTPEPSQLQQVVMQQSAHIIQMQALIMQYGKDISNLKGGQK